MTAQSTLGAFKENFLREVRNQMKSAKQNLFIFDYSLALSSCQSLAVAHASDIYALGETP